MSSAYPKILKARSPYVAIIADVGRFVAKNMTSRLQGFAGGGVFVGRQSSKGIDEEGL